MYAYRSALRFCPELDPENTCVKISLSTLVTKYKYHCVKI